MQRILRQREDGNMINPDYWAKLECGLEYVLKNQDLNMKEVYVLPADEYAVEVIEYLRRQKIQVKAILDNREGLLGEFLCGVPIKTVESELYPFNSRKQVVLASSYWNISLITKLDFIECWHNINRFLLCEETYSTRKPKTKREIKLVSRLKACGLIRILRNAIHYKKADKLLKQIQGTALGKLYMFPHRSIGDIFILGTYLSQDNWKFQGDFSLVVVGNACKKIAEQSGFRHVVAITQQEMDMLLFYKLFMGDMLNEVDILHYDYMGRSIYHRIFDQKKYEFLQCYQHLVFDEPTSFINKGIESINANVEEYCRENKIVKGKSVILAPYNKSVPDLSPVFWESLATNLKKQGFTVFSNSAGDLERPVHATKALGIPLEIVNEVVNYAGYFVGLRSGLCDVVSGCNASKVVVFPKLKGSKTSILEFYSLNSVGIRYPMNEIECDRVPNVENDVKKVVKLLLGECEEGKK